MAERPLVRNTSDREQVEASTETVALRNLRERKEWLELMGTKTGRSRMFAILSWCGTFESIMETNARIYYNAGRQDVGHELMATLNKASPQLYLLMQQEAGKLTTEQIAHPTPKDSTDD